VDDLLLALRRAGDDPHADGADATVRAGLRHPSARVVAKAAKVVASHGLAGHEADLVAAFDRFMVRPDERDVGCLAKTAVAEALDFTDYAEPAPFLRGVRHVQFEKSWGPPVDTAAPLRARSALALVRMRHEGVLSILADLLADPEPTARAAAGTAVGYHGDPQGAALLRLKLQIGDEEPDVTASCTKALIDLDASGGLALAARLLDRSMPATTREGVVLGLGESRRAEALPLLEKFVETCVREPEFALAMHAVRNLRCEKGRTYLLLTIARGDLLRARAAVRALAFDAREPGLAEAVRRAAAENGRAGLDDALAEAFPAT